MGAAAGPRAISGADLKIKSPNCPTGRCGVRLDGINNAPSDLWIDMTYDGGGWVLVLANRKDTGGMNNLTYSNAVNTLNYRTGGSSQGSNTTISNISGKVLSDFNCFVGMKYWYGLCQNVYANYITVVQFVSTSARQLNDTGNHTKRYRWRSTQLTGTYAFQSAGAVSNETSTGSPGFFTSHAQSANNLTTYDNDQDIYGSNCSALYNNNPWWYNNCWSGNYFAGNGYADAPYWDGSGSDYHNYGAVYIK